MDYSKVLEIIKREAEEYSISTLEQLLELIGEDGLEAIKDFVKGFTGADLWEEYIDAEYVYEFFKEIIFREMQDIRLADAALYMEIMYDIFNCRY